MPAQVWEDKPSRAREAVPIFAPVGRPARYCHDLSWLGPSSLKGFGEVVMQRLLRRKLVAVFESRAEAIGEAIGRCV